MQQSDPDQSIYAAVVACIKLFDLYLTSPKTAETSRDVAAELLGRFNLFAAHAGALAPPKASLDARLADHSDVRDMVLELLAMVQRNIIQELRLSDAESAPDSEPVELSEGDPPLVLGLSAVDAALNRLNSLAVAIRRSAVRNYQQPVAVGAAAAHFAEELCYKQFVRRRFPHASDSLVEHVGRSIHTRGRSMYYQQRHNKKIREIRKQTEPDLPEAPGAPEGTTVDQPTVSATRNPERIIPMSETNASRIDKVELHRQVAMPKPSLSHISRGSSVRESQDEKFGYPKKPSATKSTSPVDACPFCSEPLELASLTDRRWQDHVDRDLEPYVCISEGCKNPFQFFTTARDWKDHMQRMHTLDWAWNTHTSLWRCVIDHAQIPDELDRKEFDDKDAFLQHLSKAHGGSLSWPQILARARRGKTFRNREPFTCPFCDCQPDEVVPRVSERPYDLLSEHVARHLKALAFISLSYLDLIDDYSESSNSGKKGNREDTATASDRDDAFDDIPQTVARETEELAEDQGFMEPKELDDPIVWPTLLARKFPEPDLTLESFAAAAATYQNRARREEAVSLEVRVVETAREAVDKTPEDHPDLPPPEVIIGKTDFMDSPISSMESVQEVRSRAQERSAARLQTKNRVQMLLDANAEFVVDAAAENRRTGKEDMMLLLERRGDQSQITPELVEEIAGSFDEEVMMLLLEKRGDQIQITTDVVKAAAGNQRSGKEVMMLLLEKRGDQVQITTDVVEAAAGNQRSGKEVIMLLLEKRGDQILRTPLHPAAELGADKEAKEDCEQTLLHWAAANGHEAVAKLLVEVGADKEAKGADGHTPLSRAAQNGHEAIVEQLLATGKVDVNSKDNDGQTPLSRAAQNGREAVVEQLLATGKVDVDSKDGDGQTPLSLAAQNGHEAVVEQLLATGKVDVNSKDAKYGQTPLSYAAENGHEAVVKLLLATGSVDIDSKNHYEATPLSYAAEKGHEAVVKLLLATGSVDVNSKNQHGATPLAHAARKGHEAIVKLLLATGSVDIDSKNQYGTTPLAHAAREGHEAVVKLLLATGSVDIDSKNHYEATPLSYAAEKGHEAVVKLLLATGKVDVDSKDGDGQTPLSLAAQNGHEAVVEQLLATGKVDVNSKDAKYGQTPLSYAAEKGHEAVVKLLLATGSVDVNSKNQHGATPLAHAAREGHEAVVKLLLATGSVNVNSKNQHGATPLAHAAVAKLLE